MFCSRSNASFGFIRSPAGGRGNSILSGTDEVICGLSGDWQELAGSDAGVPRKIDRVEIATGRREPWKEIYPADLPGVQGIPIVRFSADGKSYAYSTLRVLSDLYLVDGLKSNKFPEANLYMAMSTRTMLAREYGGSVGLRELPSNLPYVPLGR